SAFWYSLRAAITRSTSSPSLLAVFAGAAAGLGPSATAPYPAASANPATAPANSLNRSVISPLRLLESGPLAPRAGEPSSTGDLPGDRPSVTARGASGPP